MSSTDNELARLRNHRIGYILVESRVRRAGALFSWMLEKGASDSVETVYNEQELLDAVGPKDVPRSLARELLRTQGGRREQAHSNGAWIWLIDMNKFLRPVMHGMLNFLSAIPQLQDEGKLSLVTRTDEWELYAVKPD
jgi:hypothetical protein